jgi:hypothetical protein
MSTRVSRTAKYAPYALGALGAATVASRVGKHGPYTHNPWESKSELAIGFVPGPSEITVPRGYICGNDPIPHGYKVKEGDRSPLIPHNCVEIEKTGWAKFSDSFSLPRRRSSSAKRSASAKKSDKMKGGYRRKSRKSHRSGHRK